MTFLKKDFERSPQNIQGLAEELLLNLGKEGIKSLITHLFGGKRISVKEVESILSYFLTLDAETLRWVIEQMLNPTPQKEGFAPCGTAPGPPYPTPNGSYVCRDGKWVWVPST